MKVPSATEVTHEIVPTATTVVPAMKG